MPSHEALILPIRELIVPTPEDRRAALVAELRATHVELDDRPYEGEWKKENIWFHSLQDTTTAVMYVNHDMLLGPLRSMQACFVKDLDRYMAGLPEAEAEMREVFQTVFDAGTSDYWDLNPDLPVRLSAAYWHAANEVITSWSRTP